MYYQGTEKQNCSVIGSLNLLQIVQFFIFICKMIVYRAFCQVRRDSSPILPGHCSCNSRSQKSDHRTYIHIKHSRSWIRGMGSMCRVLAQNRPNSKENNSCNKSQGWRTFLCPGGVLNRIGLFRGKYDLPTHVRGTTITWAPWPVKGISPLPFAQFVDE